MSLIEKFDKALEEYYDTFEHLKSIHHYRNDENIGKFVQFCDENGIDEDDIEWRIQEGAEDCLLTQLDVDENGHNRFPLNKPISDEPQRNAEIFRILKNLYIDVTTPPIKPSQVQSIRHILHNDYIFSGQHFVYDGQRQQQNTDDVSLLVFGFMHQNQAQLGFDEYIGGIPDDIIKITIFFYGKKYFIHGPPPRLHEYDYAMHILSPLRQLGIRTRQSKVVGLFRTKSQHNIIYGSNIIQINDTYIGNERSRSRSQNIDDKQVNALLYDAKRHTPSYIVFRCKKEDQQKGTHLRFDVALDAKSRDKRQIFPYYKFMRSMLQPVLDDVFAEFGDIDIMEIYAQRHHSSDSFGGYGICMLLFVNNDQRYLKNYELDEKVTELTAKLRHNIDARLVVKYRQKLESIKANGIHCAWSKKLSLHDLCTLVKEESNDDEREESNDDEFEFDDEDVWHFLMVDIEKMDLFHVAHYRKKNNVAHFGQVLCSEIGFPPMPDVQLKLLREYKFYSNPYTYDS